MKLLPVLLYLVFASSAFARDFRPEAHMETLPAGDSSVQECYIFRTTAGVHYTVESSNDLTHWTAEDEIYGLGNEYVVTMRQFTPPPPPPPGSPPITFPPPAKNVSIRMERCSAAGGGTVVSWPSLDHAGPITVRIAGEMVPEWFQVPLYFERFANYYFFVWHPNAVASPPAVNSILGANDSAMLAVLEASLPAMNGQVATSVAAARNAPVPTPVPVDPDSKRFWRILVDSGIDTDSDGTPDWSEFEMQANAAAGLPVHTVGNFQNGTAPRGNAFSPDSNDDGILDGEQLDTDDDSIADAFDIASGDTTATYEIGPLPRYALFPIANAQPGTTWPSAIQINDQGTVLYATGTWAGGGWLSLAGTAAGPSDAARAARINDSGEIVGVQSRITLGQANDRFLGNIVYWPDRNADFTMLEMNGDYPWVGAWHLSSPGWTSNNFSNDGQFIGYNQIGNYDEDGHLESAELTDSFLWTLPGNGRTPGKVAVPLSYGGVLDASHYWGDPISAGGMRLFSGGIGFTVPHVIKTVHLDSGAGLIATFEYDEDTQVLLGGTWQPSPTLAKAIDISASGTAIGRNHNGLIAPILLNGHWTDIKRYAPGAPSEWADINTKLIDTTPGGWVLATRNNGTYAGAPGVMLPLTVDGVNNAASPVNLEDSAAGVDRISMGASSGNGHVPEIWIMAPISGSNTVRFRAPLDATSTLKLKCEKVTFTPDLLNTGDQQIQVAGNATATEDVKPVLKLGSQVESISVPLRIKIMKKRVVKVALHKVLGLGDTSVQTTPQYMPTEVQLEQYLDQVYGRQVNTTFDVIPYVESGPNRPHPEEEGIDFDLNNDHKLYVPTASPELTAATPHSKSFGQTATANIDVWVIGGGVALMHFDQNSVERQAYGITYGSTNIVVDGDLTVMPGRSSNIPAGGELNQVMHTIAHEIGHVMTDDGHPGEPGYESVLVWEGRKDPYLKKRLMCSGFEADPKNPGSCLIKKEWDRIEEWLRNEEANQRL